MSGNLLEDLKNKIDQYDQLIKRMSDTINQKNMELNNISMKMMELKSLVDKKKNDVNRIQNKIQEKSKICNEARTAYNRIVDNTSKLLQAVNNEATV